MMIADDIKKLLKGTIDEKLEVIERRTNERMKTFLNTQEVPKEFETVVYEVSLKRFNRIGQEGMQSYSQEGLSMAFPDSDFSEYQNEIDEFKRKDQEELYKPKRGRFKSKYDPDLGEWVEGKPERTRTEANVTDIGTDRSVTIFGSVEEGVKVIRTQSLFSIPTFDYIEIEGKTWQQKTARNPAYRNSLIVQEVVPDEGTT